MSATAPNRKPPPLYLNGAPVRPQRAEARTVHISLDRAEYDRLSALQAGVHRWTGHCTTLTALARQAVTEYTRRNRLWIETRPDAQGKD